ncbi:YbaB/EbfC family nucleoid-associated protein [Hankyongella ginsenosidimutans]|uniref:Nucleoid-associated protein E6W36_06700 n=1 Tax=Hankyongella ginsenosidimutans TaxID=1763828 RepID=A0A4D7C0W2_9SPHN|nr:YbaB/EbfC family nucleoid-associated protein [Hankyongella ginsenosidimutans]QCI79354.1 YbaB/EbfC family nucleoid-associated protein [Hankyongella ginsenosidimutans]TXG83467.1 MAG: YbaB/EbfC family nucleoid-associated protein [Sphingomonadales bacterium]
MNLHKIMEAAQGMQAKMAEAQGKLDNLEVQGQSGGGLVSVTASARGRIVRIGIDPSLIVPDDKEMLEDLLVAAINDARAKGEELAQSEMAKLTQGLPLPPGMKLPF